ncbi:unnamed protein product [Rotaria sp. Silwood1]|nr:unnamed protein product [Rotaria sp. Silwood1]CAF3520078.1 unnamed protein product [Rotaria sp. Silwood1]CAF3789838.1 unnamed protein product [Rotaria sp. Silwood1]CAF4542252.1 unnamed protein product [Rotaria sp. Silwood1]CAF4777120.1 unnamed protein product [Rotaria sp. Silwood1]
MILPHLHPRAAQVYYIIKGKFEFGFIQENGANYVQHTIQEGQGTVFSQGALHYFINNECQEASLVAVTNSEDPGRIDVVDALFNVFPQSTLIATLNGQNPTINRSIIQTIDPAKGTPECRRRCKLS